MPQSGDIDSKLALILRLQEERHSDIVRRLELHETRVAELVQDKTARDAVKASQKPWIQSVLAVAVSAVTAWITTLFRS